MHTFMKVRLLFFFLLCATFLGKTQDWIIQSHFEGMENEVSSTLTFSETGNLLIGGAFSGTLQYEGSMLESTGEDDIFLFELLPDQTVAWSFTGGSVVDDALVAVERDVEGNIYLAGTYWIEASFGSITLTSSLNSRAIFLLKLNANGEPLWGKSIDGSALKDVGGLVVAADGSFFLTGYFGGNLLLDEDNSLSATGNTDTFFTKWSSDGDLIWAKQAGQTENTRAVTSHLSANGDLITTGIFDGMLEIDGNSLFSESDDWDVFLIELNQESGALQWLRQAGGVFDQLVESMDTDLEGNIYLTGSIVGVMSLSTEISIQSETANPDLFIVKYAADGTPLWAKAAGSDLSQKASSLHVDEQELAICGFTQGAFSIDGQTLNPGEGLGGFALGFDLDATLQWWQAFGSEGSVFCDRITHASDGTTLLSGSFQETLSLDTDILAIDGFDLFIASRGNITSVGEEMEMIAPVLYPNPTAGQLSFSKKIELAKVNLYDSMGKKIAVPVQEDGMDLSNLKTGLYLVEWIERQRKFIFKIVVER